MSETHTLEGVSRQPTDADWLDLLLRPERFFPAAAEGIGRPLLVASILILGTNAGMERLGAMAVASLVQGDEVRVVESWSLFWITALGGAVLTGPLNYFVVGYWYWLRIRWSGAARPDARLARRMYLLTSMVVAVPTIGIAALESSTTLNPAQAWAGGTFVATSIVAPFFAIFVSHRAVVTAFSVERGRALFWFAIAPSAVYGGALVLGGLVGMGWIG